MGLRCQIEYFKEAMIPTSVLPVGLKQQFPSRNAVCIPSLEGTTGDSTMKNYMLVKQRVTDPGQFQSAFDELKPMREAHGLTDIGQFRSADEPDTVIVIMEVANIARAREYWHSAVLAEGRRKAGAVGPIQAGVDQVWLTNGTVRESLME